jgi:hypothetical protein
MPRRQLIEKRPTLPDPRFNSVLVSKFINGLMEQGKKSIAQSIFYGAMDILERQVKDEEPQAVFEKAMDTGRRRHLPGTCRGAARAAQCLGYPVGCRLRPETVRPFHG